MVTLTAGTWHPQSWWSTHTRLVMECAHKTRHGVRTQAPLYVVTGAAASDSRKRSQSFSFGWTMATPAAGACAAAGVDTHALHQPLCCSSLG
jgi:hypothetical protein